MRREPLQQGQRIGSASGDHGRQDVQRHHVQRWYEALGQNDQPEQVANMGAAAPQGEGEHRYSHGQQSDLPTLRK